MDNISEILLEVIATQGRINGLKSEISQVTSKIVDLDNQIDAKGKEKKQLFANKDKAGVSVKSAKSKVSVAKDRLDAAKGEVKEAEAELKAAEVEQDKFGDEVFQTIDEQVEEMKNEKEETIKNKDILLEDMVIFQAKLDKLQGELKSQGYELSIGTPRPPKTTYL